MENNGLDVRTNSNIGPHSLWFQNRTDLENSKLALLLQKQSCLFDWDVESGSQILLNHQNYDTNPGQHSNNPHYNKSVGSWLMVNLARVIGRNLRPKLGQKFSEKTLKKICFKLVLVFKGEHHLIGNEEFYQH